MIGTTVAPDGSVSYNQLVSAPRKEIEKLYLNVPPPVLYASWHIPVVLYDRIHAVARKQSHLGRLSGEGDI